MYWWHVYLPGVYWARLAPAYVLPCDMFHPIYIYIFILYHIVSVSHVVILVKTSYSGAVQSILVWGGNVVKPHLSLRPENRNFPLFSTNQFTSQTTESRDKSQESRVSPSILKKCWVTVCFLVLLQSIGIWISQNYRTQQASSLKSSKKQKLLIHQIKDQITQESPTVIPHLDFWHYTWSNLFYSLR